MRKEIGEKKMIHNYSYRNTDGSVTVNNVGMTKATYQHIHDSVMCEHCPIDFIVKTMEEKDPHKREELYRKLVFEAYVESLAPLSQWVYRGSEDEAQDYFWITECTISKEVFEEMESDAWSYSDESVLSFDEEETEEARESAYIKTIVEEYIRQRAFNAERNSISLSDDEFETVFERYVC